MLNTLQSSINSILKNYSRNTQNLANSLARLSSGMRVSSAADGGADEVHIQNLSSQIESYSRGILNVNDANSMIETAGSALDQMLELAYNIRDLASQSSDPSVDSGTRSTYNTEAQQLLSQFNNFTTGTEYDYRNLIDNSLGSVNFQNGITPSSNFNFFFGDARSTTLGQVAVYSGAQNSLSAALGYGSSAIINGVGIAPAAADGVSYVGGTYSAIAVTNAINALTNSNGVTAENLGTNLTIAFDPGGQGTFSQTLTGTDFTINNVAVTGTSITTSTALVADINNQSGSTGVTASLDTSGNIVLSAQDGRNINIVISNSSGDNFYDWFNVSANAAVFTATWSAMSAGSNDNFSGAVRISSSSAITISGTNPSLGIGFSSATYAPVASTALEYINLNSTTSATQALKTMNAVIAQISTLRTNIGAVHSRLEASSSYLTAELSNDSEAKSDVEGVDLPLETANVVMEQILQNSGIAALTQANVSRETVLKLLS